MSESIRCGDIVEHGPTGEQWVVAYVDGDRLAWCGWPEGEAKLSDCKRVETVDDAEHLHWLEQVANSKTGRRARMAQLALDALKTAKGK